MAGPSRTEAALPSFYSPRSTPRDAGDTDNLPSVALDDNDTAPPASAPVANADQDEASIAPPPVGTAASAAPPPALPALLSPSFTPPSTPGTSTPSTGARAIPVDSLHPSFDQYARPRLVERLPTVECYVRARIPTVGGTEMFLHCYSNDVDNKEHLAIVFGDHIRSRTLDAPREGETEQDRLTRGAYKGRLFPGRTTSGMMGDGEVVEGDGRVSGNEQQQGAGGEGEKKKEIPLVRIHSECYTGETAWSARCDCGEQLDEAARLMSLPSNQAAGGIIIYLRQEGRGIGLGEKLKAYNLQDLGSDTVEANLLLRHPADARSYGLATAMLLDLGQRDIRLLTNNPDKIRAVEGPNREIVVRERVEMVPLSWRGRGGFRSKEVEGYLKTKIEKMGHMLDMDSIPSQ